MQARSSQGQPGSRHYHPLGEGQELPIGGGERSGCYSGAGVCSLGQVRLRRGCRGHRNVTSEDSLDALVQLAGQRPGRLTKVRIAGGGRDAGAGE